MVEPGAPKFPDGVMRLAVWPVVLSERTTRSLRIARLLPAAGSERLFASLYERFPFETLARNVPEFGVALYGPVKPAPPAWPSMPAPTVYENESEAIGLAIAGTAGKLKAI